MAKSRRARDLTSGGPAPRSRAAQQESGLTLPAQWGSLTRKGARRVAEGTWGTRDDRNGGDGRDQDHPGTWEPDQWVRVDEGTTSHATPPARRPSRALPDEVVDELAGELGADRAERFRERLAEAARSYERDRYREALRTLRALTRVAPGAPAVRELYGLTLYRLGRWAEAVRELETFRRLTGSYDQHPTLADCYRALHRYREVDELWDELRRASPGAELVAEGRIVAAGALADQGDLAGAIELLGKAKASVRNPRPHHLRVWYALADLYERAGDLPRARELFRRVAEHEAGLSDVRERLAALA